MPADQDGSLSKLERLQLDYEQTTDARRWATAQHRRSDRRCRRPAATRRASPHSPAARRTQGDAEHPRSGVRGGKQL